MKKLINTPLLYIIFVAVFTWIISISALYKKNEPTPKLFRNLNGSNGDIISINQDGIWTLNANNITIWNEIGDIKATIVKPINNCDRIWVKESLIGIYGLCGNNLYELRTNNQSFLLTRTSFNNMFDLCIADSNLLVVNHNGMQNFTNFTEDYNLKFYLNQKDINGYIINSQQEKNRVVCTTYCEMSKGLVYYIDSNKGDIKSISFNNTNISFQTHANAFVPNTYIYYKLNKLSDNEMSLMVEDKLYIYETSSQGLTLKSSLE
jgi:hypothetical protein